MLGVRTEVERARVMQARLGSRVFYLMSAEDNEREWLLHTAAADASLIIEVTSCAHLDQVMTALDCLDLDNVPPSLTVHRRTKSQPHHQRVLRPSLSVWHFTATPHVALLVPVSFRSTPSGLVNAALHLCPSLETTLTRGHCANSVRGSRRRRTRCTRNTGHRAPMSARLVRRSRLPRSVVVAAFKLLGGPTTRATVQ